MMSTWLCGLNDMNINIIGASGTGKSPLGKALAEKFEEPLSTQVQVEKIVNLLKVGL